jgi:hypothetical protein
MVWLKRKKWLGKVVVWLALDSEFSMKNSSSSQSRRRKALRTRWQSAVRIIARNIRFFTEALNGVGLRFSTLRCVSRIWHISPPSSR